MCLKAITSVTDAWIEVKDLHQEFAKNGFKNWTRNVMDVIRPLDLAYVRELLLDAQKVEHTIRGKDIVLLLGVTGAGKSTTSQFLAGKRMTNVVIGSQQVPHILPEKTLELINLYESLGLNLDDLDKVYCSPRYEAFFQIGM